MSKENRVPYQFLSEVKDGKQFLTLSGTIRKRYWSEDKCIDAKLVRDALDGVTNDVVIYLNSGGGDTFQGVEIYNYLKEHPSKVTVEVTGQAASAATFIMSGADEVIMNTGTTIMIHEAAAYAQGNKGEIEKLLKALETVDDAIIGIYTEKTGQTAQQITQWMKEEKWFTAEQAVEYGFADRVKKETSKVEDEEIKAMIDTAVMQAMAKYQMSGKAGNSPMNHEGNQPINKGRSLIDKLRKEVI